MAILKGKSEMREVTREEAGSKVGSGYNGEFNDDILAFYDDCKIVEKEKFTDQVRIVEATAKELGDLNIGTACGGGDGHNKPFRAIAKMWPDLMIHACLGHYKDGERIFTSSCQILVASEEHAVCVSALASLGGGSLREDFCEGDFDNGPKWTYFETE